MKEDLLWAHMRELPYFRAMLRAVEASFYENFEFSAPLLDVGCGDGHFTQVAFTQKVDIGIDPDLGIMREAQSRQVYRMLMQADGGQLPLPSASVGAAFSNSVLEHIPHLDRVLLEVGRVLKPGSPFLFQQGQNHCQNQKILITSFEGEAVPLETLDKNLLYFSFYFFSLTLLILLFVFLDQPLLLLLYK